MREKTVVYVTDDKIIELFYGGFTKKQLESYVASSESTTLLEARKKVEMALYTDYMKKVPKVLAHQKGQSQKYSLSN